MNEKNRKRPNRNWKLRAHEEPELEEPVGITWQASMPAHVGWESANTPNPEQAKVSQNGNLTLACLATSAGGVLPH